MAGKKGFENLEPIFGEAKAEFEHQQQQHASLIFSRPFLFYVHALDPSRLEILASDFHSHTFARTLTVHQLDDLLWGESMPIVPACTLVLLRRASCHFEHVILQSTHNALCGSELSHKHLLDSLSRKSVHQFGGKKFELGEEKDLGL